MTSVKIPNNPVGRSVRAPSHPLKNDGSWYNYLMVIEENRHVIVYADSLGELIEEFIPHYTQLSENEKTLVRMHKAQEFQEQTKEALHFSLTTMNPALEAWEKNVLETVIFSQACVHGWGSGDHEILVGSNLSYPGQPRDYWKSEVPLPLLETDYEPFTGVPLPLSGLGDYREPENIIWFRSATEDKFLSSLAHAGIIKFGNPSLPAPRTVS